MNRPECSTPEDLQVAIQAFLDRHDLALGAKFYTKKEWIERKEHRVSADGADLHLISEGPLYFVMNNAHADDERRADQIRNLAWRHGYLVEMGYAWSLHFFAGKDGAEQ